MFVLPTFNLGVVGSPTAPPFTNQYSISLDGTDDYLEIPQGAFDLGTGNWTFSFWFRPTGITGTSETIFMVKGSSGKYLAGFVNNGAFMLSDWNNTTLSYSTTLSNNTWYHGAYIKNGSGTTDLHLYLNGSKVLEGQHPNTLNYGNDTATTRIGQIQTIGSYSFPFQGQIDEFAFWNSALSSTDIAALRDTSGSNPVPTDISSLSPIGWWRMGDGSDGSGNNDGTVVGGLPQIYNVAKDGSGNRITGIDGSLTNITSPDGIVADVPS